MIKTLKQYLFLRGWLARRLKARKEKYSASNYAAYLFRQGEMGMKNQYLNFLVEDLCTELSRYINDTPEAIKQRVIRDYGLHHKFAPEQLKQLKAYD